MTDNYLKKFREDLYKYCQDRNIKVKRFNKNHYRVENRFDFFPKDMKCFNNLTNQREKYKDWKSSLEKFRTHRDVKCARFRDKVSNIDWELVGKTGIFKKVFFRGFFVATIFHGLVGLGLWGFLTFYK